MYSLKFLPSILWMLLHTIVGEAGQMRNDSKSDRQVTINDDVEEESLEELIGVIWYDKESYLLTDASKDTIEQLMEDALEQGEILKIYIAVWSDRPYPGFTIRRLAQKQVKLAKKRTVHLVDYFQNHFGELQLTTFNMALRAGFWSSLFRTEDSLVKKVHSGESVSIERELALIAENGTSSAAVITIQPKENRRRLENARMPGKSVEEKERF